MTHNWNFTLSGVSHVHAPGTLTCDQVVFFVFFFFVLLSFFFSFLRKEGYDRKLQVPQPFIHSSG